MNVLTFIMEKIREKPDVTKPVAIESNMAEREKQVLFFGRPCFKYPLFYDLFPFFYSLIIVHMCACVYLVILHT